MGEPQTDLMEAVGADDLGGIENAVRRGADLDARCDQGASLLYGACLGGNIDVVRLILDLGADPNLRAVSPGNEIYDATPLELTMGAQFLLDWEKYTPIYELLVERGARDSEDEIPNPAANVLRQQRALALQRRQPSQWWRHLLALFRRH
jgi:hypothetical protein